MTTALVLAGHGSHISPETAGLVWYHVDELRAINVADEVTAAFWKEQPSFHTVFNSLEADDITIVPLFTAQGYFTQTVIPAEMGLSGAITQRAGRTIRYTRTLSEHSYLGQVVRRRLEEELRIHQISPDRLAVAIIGHSTRRNPESRRATEAQAEAIRQTGLAGEVVAVYLDDTPTIADIYTLTHAPNVVVVPYFLALGSHTTIDVPRELGLHPQYMPYQRTGGVVNGRAIYYTLPVGIEDDLRGVILELAREAGAPLKPPRAESPWRNFPKRGVDSLHQQVRNTGIMRFGQLRLTTTEVRHWDDENPDITITDPSELRRRVRENPFRPLATSTDLPRGWRVPLEPYPGKLGAVIETIYPGAIGNLIGQFPKIGSFAELIARQTGQYRKLDQLDRAQQESLVERICTNCVQEPTWFSPHSEVQSIVRCPEACNFWLSAAVKELDGDEIE